MIKKLGKYDEFSTSLNAVGRSKKFLEQRARNNHLKGIGAGVAGAMFLALASFYFDASSKQRRLAEKAKGAQVYSGTADAGTEATDSEVNTSMQDHLCTATSTWLIATVGYILAGYLSILVFNFFCPSWASMTLIIVLTICALSFARCQGKKYPLDKVGEKEAVQISKISIASMLVPFYFIFIFILQVLHFINPKELDWILPIVITIIAVKVILLIGFLPHKFQLHGKGKMFYSWILVVLSTTVVAVGFDPILGQTKKDFLEIYSVCVFLFLASVLTVAYLSQRPRDFILKLLINKTNLKGKTILYVSGISGGWWFLWLITSSTELHVACMIFFIAVITFWQSYSVEETGKWIFDETHSGSSLVVT